MMITAFLTHTLAEPPFNAVDDRLSVLLHEEEHMTPEGVLRRESTFFEIESFREGKWKKIKKIKKIKKAPVDPDAAVAGPSLAAPPTQTQPHTDAPMADA